MQPNWNRLVRFVAVEDGQIHLGEPKDGSIDVGLAANQGQKVTLEELSGEIAWDASVRKTGKTLTLQKLLSPVASSHAGTLRCIGVNYADHAAETHSELPPVPTLFLKPAEAIADPNSTVMVPRICQNEEVDWEVELAAVIGKDCRNVSEADALDYVLGITVANDITARKHQKSTTQWCFGKGFDGFAPLGPQIVSLSTIGDVQNLNLKCTVNGQVKQDSSTKKMIFPLAKIISYLSQGTTLRAGTVILTGTPMGIGASLDPPDWLKDGDEVIVSIDKVGSVVNTIKYE